MLETTKKIGDRGESAAQEYLKSLGYKILERNWKYSRVGEIDIIALDKATLVFIEVKYRRSNTFGTPLEAITKSKLEKLQKSIYAYLAQTNVKYKNYRLDAISIENEKIEHFKNIS